MLLVFIELVVVGVIFVLDLAVDDVVAMLEESWSVVVT